MFDKIVESNFPDITKSVGVKPFQEKLWFYPKVNVYEYDDKVGVMKNKFWIDKKDLSVEVEDGVLTESESDKHGLFDDILNQRLFVGNSNIPH